MPQNKKFWVAGIAGFATPVLINEVSRYLGVFPGMGVHKVAVGIFFFLGVLIAVLLPHSKFYGGLIALAAIALGVPSTP